MDVFDWVYEIQGELYEADEDRFADLFDELCHAAYHGNYKDVEATYPELLNFARERRLPWVEVYARHWSLQGHVPKGHNIRECLPEAVSLLEFCSREEARDCPQSICAVQDLSMCYGQIDGPGYANERVAVVEETLDRIDPSWPCFDCLSLEKAEALVDRQAPQDAIDFILGQVKLAKTVGRNLFTERHFLSQVVYSLIEAYIQIGEYDEALKWCERSRPNEKKGRMCKLLLQSQAFLYRGDHQKALETLPPYDKVAKVDGVGPYWADAVWGLVSAGELPNDWGLGRQMKKLFHREYANGRLRDAFRVGLVGARLALGRNAWSIAWIHLHYLRPLLDELVKPQGAGETLAELDTDVQTLRDKARSAGPGAKPDEDPESTLDALALGGDVTDKKELRKLLRKIDEPADMAEAVFAAGAA